MILNRQDLVKTIGNQTISGIKTFNSPVVLNGAPTESNHAVRLQDVVIQKFYNTPGNLAGVDLNNYWNRSGIYGIYQGVNAPTRNIAVLEVYVYNALGWALQRFTDIQTGAMYERRFTVGTTWSSWVQRW